MKIKLSENLPVGRQRTLKILSETFFEMLQEKDFETITVRELCIRSMIPRSTFYGYFDDMYDLMDYTFKATRRDLLKSYDNDVMYDLPDAFAEAADYISANRRIIRRIMRHNPAAGAMQIYYQSAVSEALLRIYRKFPYLRQEKYPEKIQAKMAAGLLIALIDWFTEDDRISRDEMVEMMLRSLRLSL